ncbi:hypothetical protein AALP_AAs62321U000100, partial [Arabis alpina]
ARCAQSLCLESLNKRQGRYLLAEERLYLNQMLLLLSKDSKPSKTFMWRV